MTAASAHLLIQGEIRADLSNDTIAYCTSHWHLLYMHKSRLRVGRDMDFETDIKTASPHKKKLQLQQIRFSKGLQMKTNINS